MRHPKSTSTPLADRVYGSLLDDLTKHRRGAGDRLVEAEIARDMDVSRTPVREALSRLENDGLIAGQRTGGYAVIIPSLDDIRDIFEIRTALEPMAFANVVRTADTEGDIEIEKTLHLLRQAHTMGDAVDTNIGFRSFWMNRIQNTRLRDMLRRFDMQVQIVRAATLYSEEARRSAREGAETLAQAYIARTPEIAEKAMRDFIASAFRYFEQADAENLLRPVSNEAIHASPPQTNQQQSAND